MKNSVIFRILSPLGFFVLHVVYLIAWSEDPFLKKWIEGSFTFFVALVLSNIIRAHLVPTNGSDELNDHGSDGSGIPASTEAASKPASEESVGSDLPHP